MQNRSFTILLAGALALAVTPALACKGAKTLLSDDFREVEESWSNGPKVDTVTVEDGKVKIKASPGMSFTFLYAGIVFDDIDACLTLRNPNSYGKADEMAGGIAFWAQDRGNFYTFMIDPNGRVSVQRLSKGKWITVLDWRDAPSANKGPSAENVLRVTTSGSTFTVYVNDQKVAAGRGQVPDNAQLGLVAQSETARRDTWKFSNLKVTDPH